MGCWAGPPIHKGAISAGGEAECSYIPVPLISRDGASGLQARLGVHHHCAGHDTTLAEGVGRTRPWRHAQQATSVTTTSGESIRRAGDGVGTHESECP